MRKVYIFAYGPPATRDSVKAVLDAMPEVATWRYDLPNAFYVVSANSANELAKSYKSRRSDDGRFLISEFSDNNNQGWLPSDTWYLLNNKHLKPKQSEGQT